MRRHTAGLRLVLAIPLTAAAWFTAAPGSSLRPTVTAAPVTAAFVPVGPVRLADTRLDDCGCVRIDPSTFSVAIGGRRDVPAGVVAAAITVTATPTPRPGFVTVYPDGTARPEVSTLNTRGDRVVANSAIVPVGANGRLVLYSLEPGDVIVDLTGVFVAATESRAGRYVGVATRRLADTRIDPPAQPLAAQGELTVPMPAEVPSDATALAVNVTSVGEPAPSFLSARPAGTLPTDTSFVNLNGSGQAVAATTIVPASPNGITIKSLAGGQVIVDLLGYFTGASAPTSTEGLYVPIGPQRLLDTRLTPPRAWPGGTIETPTSWPGAGSLVTNVTVTLADRAGFVTAYPAGTPRPATSTLNPAMFDHTLANLAITRVSTRGLAYFALTGGDIVIDVTGMFTGAPVAASEPPASNALPSRQRALIVGDSTLASLLVYSSTLTGLVGFESIVDAASCRRLLRPSCHSATTNITPNTAVEAILTTPGHLDIVVVKAGYNDWFSDFPREFNAVVQASRAKGAHTILWLTYNDGWRSTSARAYWENNVDLYWLTALPQYSDVLLADWRTYSNSRHVQDWTVDGHHLTQTGSWLLTDYISRWVAAIQHLPCPRPFVDGGQVASPCPPPDAVGPVPDPRSLYT